MLVLTKPLFFVLLFETHFCDNCFQIVLCFQLWTLLSTLNFALVSCYNTRYLHVERIKDPLHTWQVWEATNNLSLLEALAGQINDNIYPPLSLLSNWEQAGFCNNIRWTPESVPLFKSWKFGLKTNFQVPDSENWVKSFLFYGFRTLW